MSIGFDLVADPDEGEGATRAESSSWGRLTIWVVGHPLTAFTDTSTAAEPSMSVAWYLLPFAEWLAHDWDPLLHEQVLPWLQSPRSPAGDWFEESTRLLLLRQDEETFARLARAQAWWHRHTFDAGADGGVLPRVTLLRIGDDVEVSWNNEERRELPEGFRFLESRGHARLPAEIAARTLYGFLEGVSAALADCCPEDARVKALCERVAALKTGARVAARSSWLMGFGENPGFLARVRRVATLSEAARSGWDSLVRSQASVDRLIAACSPTALLFASVAPNVSAADAGRLLSVLWNGESPGPRNEPLERWVSDARLSDNQPYLDGYALALQLRDHIGLGREPVDMADLLERLGVTVGDVELQDRTIRGVCFVSPEHRPTVLVNQASPFGRAPWSRNAILAHELCHLLHDREHARRVAVASGAWAPRGLEKRANAFAVMFLIPETAIAIKGRPKFGDIQRTARRFGASFRAVAYHFLHLGLLDRSGLAEVLGQIPAPEANDPELEDLD